MTRSKLLAASLTFLIVSAFLISRPVLSIVNNQTTVGSVPMLFAFLFGFWFLIVLVAALLFNRKIDPEDK
ncbi:MAG: hypothetical protein AAFQ94_23445 [Bacteroidota bacterium]